MLLTWINVEPQNVQELLWYLHVSPPQFPNQPGLMVHYVNVTQTKVTLQNVTPKPSEDAIKNSSPWNAPRDLALQPTTQKAKQSSVFSPQPPPAPGNRPPEGTKQQQQQQALTPKSKDEVTKPVRPPPPVTIAESSVPSLFALVIGINNYQDQAISNLGGAAADANAFSSLLKDIYRVPAERIRNLRNEEATRQAILQAIEDLAESPTITNRDPIVIYYAGHGGEADSPFASPTGTKKEKIQFLIPHDFVANGSSTQEGQGIFDLTLSRLLSRIAEKKSDNITVIFDSCHSGSGTRTDKRDETLALRGVELPPTYAIPASIIKPELASDKRATVAAKGYEKKGLQSHVLLAACRQGQTAKERQSSGAFTSQLIPLLREEGLDRITYKEIIKRLPELPGGQDPQCEGVNDGRVIFDGKVATPRRALYNVRSATTKTGAAASKLKYILEAGEAHGVTKGAEFAVYSDQKMKHLIGSLKAEEVTPFNTRCSARDGSSFELPQPVYAILIRLGEQQDLRLFIEPCNEFLTLFMRIGQEMQRSDADSCKRSFRLLNDVREGCDLALVLKDNGCIQFNILDPICQRYGLYTMPFYNITTDEPDHLLTILRSAADFYWNLRHSNKEGKLMKGKVTANVKPGEPAKNFIELECFKLVDSGRVTVNFDDILEPEEDGRNNLNVEGTINIDVDEEANYGFRIKNNSNVPLFAALFYFDASDLSVVPYYMPPVARGGETDYSLPAGGSLDVGFGDSGTTPFYYRLRNSQSVDVGFLKLYVSTEYIDYSQIVQETPFVPERQTSPRETKKRYLWDSMLVPIVQRGADTDTRCFRLGLNAGISANLSAGVEVGGYGGNGGFNAGFNANFGLGFGF
ncbi:hypothetical protein AAF712_006488 [Marasmius tenuissimus]|uniref:Peptidase C14 caspase domain-containing protein n=1 Tax=Marasmius tenuissimus TaxID=585030 RepID=A0ABR2ZXX5_9AGAR